MIHQRTLHALEYDKIVSYLTDLCLSTAGKNLARALKPFEKREKAENAFNLYHEYRAFSDGQEPFAITPFPDVQDILQAASLSAGSERQGHLLDLDAFWAIRDMLRIAQKAHAALLQDKGSSLWPLLLNLAETNPLPETLLAALNRCLGDNGTLADEASVELMRIRSELRKLHQTCLRKVKDFAQKYNIQHYLQDEFITLSSDRYVLPLKANFKGRLQGIIHDWSQTGETCYFEPIFLVEINNALTVLKNEERQEERQIINYLSALTVDNLPSVQGAFDLLGLLDFLNAKKLMANNLDCHVVNFSDNAEGIELSEARHPLLAMAALDNIISGGAKSASPTPLNIVLQPGQAALVITGGNAGGKTVCLKTLGLLAAMAMSGLPVSAGKGSHLPWFRRMDAFIGDEQSLDDNVSTFTAQIKHLAKAWKHMDNQSLVLLDEFGAGTDPAEGAALSQAVLDGLLEKNCFTLCATHFPALKSYALTHKNVAAASMLFDPQTRKPLYKLAYGQVGSSLALDVAREYGLDEGILARARHYLLQDSEDYASILSRLNNLAVSREKQLERMAAEEKKLRENIKEKQAKLDRERERLQNEVKGRMAELMSEWKTGKLAAKQAMKEMGSLRDELFPEKKSADASVLPSIADFTPGLHVFHTGFNRSGVISELDERRRKARVDLDGVSLWANYDDLRKSAGTKKTISGFYSQTRPQGTGLSLDLRGMRANEALAKLETFLDKAILEGFSEVEIIHGRGTGALRKQVHEFLQSFPAISAYAIAPEDRGGDGMTIATFK